MKVTSLTYLSQLINICIKHEAHHSRLTQAVLDINFYFMRWNFVYKMWILCNLVSSIVIVVKV
jgi:hypothetical protein